MGMFSEISNGGNADAIGQKILLSIEETPDNKEFVKKYFLPIYNNFVSDSWGCYDKEIKLKIDEIFND